jgi:hypothetical protein
MNISVRTVSSGQRLRHVEARNCCGHVYGVLLVLFNVWTLITILIVSLLLLLYYLRLLRP